LASGPEVVKSGSGGGIDEKHTRAPAERDKIYFLKKMNMSKEGVTNPPLRPMPKIIIITRKRNISLSFSLSYCLVSHYII
jgi:hypothetical protein